MERMHLRPDTVTYTCLMDAHVADGVPSDAVELFDRAVRSGRLRPDALMWSVCIRALGRMGEWERAVHALDEMQLNQER
eukprot:7843213-Pyramimonas_sp.AAC.1